MTIPSNLDQDKVDDLRMQYTFDNLIKRYIKEHMEIDSLTLKSQSKFNGDLSQFIMNNFNKKIDNYSLTINNVYECKEKILNTTGHNSQNERMIIITDSYKNCYEKLETYYLTKIFLNKMKLGFGQKSVVNSLNLMKDTINKNDYINLCNVLNKIFEHNLILNNQNVKPGKYYLILGNLVELMLCKSEGSLNDLLPNLKKSKIEYFCETKYDGERTQVIKSFIIGKIHYDGETVKMFSRNFEDQSSYYPELKEQINNDIIKSNKQINNFILDGEICCFSKSAKKFSNFQDLRKKVNNQDKDYFIILFDLVYLNHFDLSKENIEIRKLNLIKFFENISKKLLIETGTKVNFFSNDFIEIIHNLFIKAKNINCEGLVLKEIGENSKYNFGKRKWYKLKSLDEKNNETLDLVPIAGFSGTGKNSHRISSFLMATFDRDKDIFISVCKLGIGFSEEDMDLKTKLLLNNCLSKKPSNYIVPQSSKPDYIFRALEVWEVGFDSFSISSNYSLGQGIIDELNKNAGLSLRFPRLMRFRPDKSIENTNSPEEIISLFKNDKNNNL